MPKITFQSNGESFEVPAGTSFLDFCQENRVPHDFGCTVGSCGTCRCLLVEGAENVNPIDDEEQETVEMSTDVEGARLGCRLVINGDVTIKAVD
ncbi:MAG: 2Fe-2S iron-sulfur cluster-binding protein [Planctomycetota bacterium]